jgi:AraC-like DNA-binding protein
MPTLSILAGSGILLGLMIIVALLSRQNANLSANRLLAASLGCSISFLVVMVFTHAGLADQMPALALFALPYLLCSPLLYGYVALLTQPGRQLVGRDWLHLWPLLVAVMFSLLASSAENFTADSLAEARGGWPPNRAALLGIFSYLVPAIYLSRALMLVRSHTRNVVEEFSYEEKVTLRWLRVLISLYLLLVMFGLTVALLRLLPGMELWPRSIYSTGMIIAIYYLIAFFGISQPDVFAHRAMAVAEVDPEPSRYETSALTDEDEKAYWHRLQAYMEESEPFLDNELRVADLAKRTAIPASHLSQTINQHAGKNFFEFVSYYRVERAKTLLATSSVTMSEVAMSAGFNSQSAFYRQFKKATGLAPKQYQRQAG